MYDEFTNRLVGELSITTTDRLAVAKNAVANARMFVAMLFAANIVAFASGYGPLHWRICMVIAVSVGLAYMADILPIGLVRSVAAYSAIGFSAVALVLSTLSIN